jgi:hypothetical protein
MTDRFKSFSDGLSTPATDAATITPSDTVPLDVTTRAVFVGTSGNLAVIMAGGESVTFVNVPVGVLPIRVTQVMDTGTSADNIVAMW